jgi:hypothetical protein
MNIVRSISLSFGLALLGVVLALMLGGKWFQAGAQEPRKFQYKIVEATTDTHNMQTLLNEYGAAGWELIAVGFGDLTSPRLIFKK